MDSGISIQRRETRVPVQCGSSGCLPPGPETFLTTVDSQPASSSAGSSGWGTSEWTRQPDSGWRVRDWRRSSVGLYGSLASGLEAASWQKLKNEQNKVANKDTRTKRFIVGSPCLRFRAESLSENVLEDIT